MINWLFQYYDWLKSLVPVRCVEVCWPGAQLQLGQCEESSTANPVALWLHHTSAAESAGAAQTPAGPAGH